MIKKTLLILLLVGAALWTYFYSIKFDKAELQNINNGEVTVIGHAGLGFVSWIPFNYYPANSLGSIKEALLTEGADGVEVDVQMTKDGDFVLFHDEKLETKSTGTGCISNLNLSEVEQLNYQVGFPFDLFQSENVLTFDRLIAFLKSLDRFPELHLDIRTKSKCFEVMENEEWEILIAKNLLEKLEVHQIPANKVVIISLSTRFTTELKTLNSPYKSSFEIVDDSDYLINFAKSNDFESVTIKPKLLSKALAASFHQEGIKVITFGAKSKSGNKKLLELNPDVIQTNNIGALKRLMGYEN